MKRNPIPRQTILLSISVVFFAPVADGQTLQSLHSFGGADGAEPVAGLIQASDGNLYGTTRRGGANNLGTVFRITPGGDFAVLVTFDGSNGAHPEAALIDGGDGNFYGTTSEGGRDSNYGTVFHLTPGGAVTTLVTFDGNNGADPVTPLIRASDGNLYGTTVAGSGTVFRMLPDGTLTTLVTFNHDNGAYPGGALVEGTDGVFYGTTIGGGDSGDGTVFSLTREGSLNPLWSFHYGGPFSFGPANPACALIEGSDGNFYGTTPNGSDEDAGIVFKMTPAGALITLHSFQNTDGWGPLAGVITGRDGNFYGTTYGGGATYDGEDDYGFGTVFMITPDGVLTSMASFNGTDGASPEAGLVQGRDGNFYGTTAAGGTNDEGTIFRLVMPGSPSYAAWAADRDLFGTPAAPGADPDRDGLPNGVEYVLGGNPGQPATSGRPAATVAGGSMVFTFLRADASETSDVTLTVESGTDCVTWPAVFSIGATTAASSAGVSIAENGSYPDTITVTVPQGSDARRFCRLKVMITP